MAFRGLVEGRLIFALFVLIASGLAGNSHFGKRFILFHAHKLSGQNGCDLEVHLTTQAANGTLVDMRTPRLRAKEGGFRKSTIVRKETGAFLCITQLEEPPIPFSDHSDGKSNNAIVIESDEDFGVMVTTRVSALEGEIHMLQPVDALGTIYYYMGHQDSVLVVVAIADDTKLDVSNCIHAHPEFQHFTNNTAKYQAFFDADGLSGHLVMSTKPVVVMTETTENKIHVSHKLGIGYAATQFLSIEKWDRKFVFPLPTNPKISYVAVQVTVMLDDEAPNEIEILIWRRAQHHPHRHMIRKPNNTLTTVLDTKGPAFRNVKLVKMCVERRASAVLLFHTRSLANVAMGISNIPPISQYTKLYMWSQTARPGWQYYFHIIGPENEINAISLTWNGKPKNITRDQVLEHYEHGTVQLVDTGMYQFASQNVPFMVYIEAYQSNESSTLLSELGMRHKDVKSQCTCHYEMKLISDPYSPCDELAAADTDDLDDEEEELSAQDTKGARREEWSPWKCDDQLGFMYKTRECIDPFLETAGLHCHMERSDNPNKPCNSSKVPCPGKKWGPRCDKQCPAQCDGKSCSRQTGTCNQGCRSGYYGVTCDSTCHAGYTGKDCATRCSTICPSRSCNAITKACDDQVVSKVTVWMCCAFMVIFVLCPGVGVGLYMLTLMRSPPGPEHYYYDYHYEDSHAEKIDDESSSSSSSSGKHTSHVSADMEPDRQSEHVAEVVEPPPEPEEEKANGEEPPVAGSHRFKATARAAMASTKYQSLARTGETEL